ncbi:DNA polymerase eta [Auxenochlorella protothecoides]|uniref:DNA polymerase eta n=1 Tax=Auxenochlorella protothecoides TaxID=3075 RepID=A0A087SBJ7_AUXPR|nr:DNA polymerase eta [Auxenochlorella protothecoides]KFM23101.1 DNA polymerase eta [Auxenochlorella protothecoides]
MELPRNKVICHVDLDAFYAQVEAKRDPNRLAGKPLAVVQYNPQGDLRTLLPEDDRVIPASPNSIIAVSYEARAQGVRRNMRGDEACALCPDLILVQVPTAHGKADLTLYRAAGRRPGEALLAAGAAVVAELRADVRTQTGYTCSAGLAHTKLLAKLASGLHKPDACTLVAAAGVPELLADLPLARLRMLGGKYGAGLTDALGVTTAGQLAALPRSRLEAVAGEKDAAWLGGLCRGVDGEEVVERRLPKSQSCGKTFRGRRSALADLNAVRHWLGVLGKELEERLAADREENGRMPTLLTVSWSRDAPPALAPDGWARVPSVPSVSRSCALRRPEAAAMADDAAALVRRWASVQPPGWNIGAMSLEASKFVMAQGESAAITRFFKAGGAQAGPSAADAVSPDGAGAKLEGDAGAGEGVHVVQSEESMCPASGSQQVAEGRRSPTHEPGDGAEASASPATRPAPGVRPGALLSSEQEAFLAELPPELRSEARAQLGVAVMRSRVAAGKRQTPDRGRGRAGAAARPARRRLPPEQQPGGSTLDRFLSGA